MSGKKSKVSRIPGESPTFLILSLSVTLGLSGCFNKFNLEKDTEFESDNSSNGDTDSTDSTDFTDSMGAETEPRECPSSLELSSTIQYTEVAASDIDGLEYFDTCPEGQVVVGFEGLLRPAGVDDEAHGTIRAICGIPSVSRVDDDCVVEIEDGAPLPIRGTDGEIEWSRMCRQDQIIVGFKAWFGHHIYKLVFRCASLVVTDNEDGYALTTGTYGDLDSIGVEESVNFLEQACPGDQIASGTMFKSDSVLRAISLGCQLVSLE